MAKKEISNNLLVFLILIAIVVSVFGTWVSLNKLKEPTGLAVGSANVTISVTIGITVNNSDINFTSTNIGIVKNSSIATHIDPEWCVNEYCGINITNDGSSLIDIQLQTTEDLWGAATNETHYMCWVNPLSSVHLPDSGSNYGSAGETLDDTNTSAVDCRNSVGNVGGTAEFIDALNFTDTSDNVYVEVFIHVPDGEEAGYKTSLLTFTSSANTNQ